MNNNAAAAPKRKVENLPRTGIEYPIMKLPTQFISQHKEMEPLTEKQCPQEKIEEYICNDQERSSQPIHANSVVYDSVEMSPNYDNTNGDLYLDERELIELPAPQSQGEGQINEPYQKKYYFNPMNLPYNLEQPASYSARASMPGESSKFGNNQEKKGPRLNRYYENLKPYYKVKDCNDKTLVFESRFESANLRKAVKISDTEYDLYLKNDYGTNGFTQWYYFNVKNTRKDKVYRFNIVNFMKPDSNYNHGMKPLIYSCKEAETNKIGWQRDGFNINYYQSARKKRNQAQAAQSGGVIGGVNSVATTASGAPAPANTNGYGSLYYALTFEIVFQHDNDTVFFAHCYPYTYSDQCEFIKKVCTFENKDKIRKTVLCKSLAGNDVDMLIVTNFLSDPIEIADRKSIVLTSRVHPGETNASWIMNGVIDFLCSEEERAKFLRTTFVFKIVPMLNPDGVIVGNYRCSLMGQDLNRQWIGSSSKFFPINYHTKLMMKRTLESRDIFFYADFHGHSTGRNCFMFGNNQTKPSERNKEKIFPMLFSENNDMFGFEDCSFTVQKSKESTARIVMWKEFQLVNSFTLEASFLGPNKGAHANTHFNPTMLAIVGRVFCKTLYDYVKNQERVNRVYADLRTRFPQGGGVVRASSNQYNNKTDEEKDY